MMSGAYAAQPDFAKVVLFALACRYHGRNNGDLSLTIKDAKALGVPHAWKLYSALALLKQGDLIELTRQGKLERGTKLCSLYALTWRGIDNSPEKVTYDAGVSVSPLPSNAWAKWDKPSDWLKTIRDISRANHGRSKIPVSTTVGNGRSTTVGKGKLISDQPRWVKEAPISVPTVVDTSKTLGGGATSTHAIGCPDPVSAPDDPAAISRSKLRPVELRGRA